MSDHDVGGWRLRLTEEEVGSDYNKSILDSIGMYRIEYIIIQLLKDQYRVLTYCDSIKNNSFQGCAHFAKVILKDVDV